MNDQTVGVSARVGPPSSVTSKHPLKRRLTLLPKSVVNKVPAKCRERFQTVVSSMASPMCEMLDSLPRGPKREAFLRDWFVSVGIWTQFDLMKDDILVWMKYELSNLLQKAVGDLDSGVGHVIPPPPSFVPLLPFKPKLFAGRVSQLVRRWVARARRGETKFRSFVRSLYEAKRVWPELGELKRREAVMDHRTLLGAEPEPVPEDILQEIRKMTKSIFRNTTLRKFSPSLSASLESSRREMGNRGYLARMGLRPFIGWEVPHILKLENQLGYEYEQPRSVKDVVTELNHFKLTAFERLDDLMQIREPVRKVRAQVIPEAGKFRIITAGPSVQYTWLQPLQGSLLDNWKNTSWATMRRNKEWIDQVLAWDVPEGWVFCSGDYKSATDRLNINATLACIGEILELYKLPKWFPHGLDGVLIEYEKGDCPNGEPVLQKNGQLMGHPLSFPILCTINISVLKCAVKRAVQLAMLTKDEGKFIIRHARVNGDDILFPCPPQFVKFWEGVTSEVGLIPSVGKSYASRDFAMINSVMLDMKNRRRFGYLNQSLIYNYSVKKGGQGAGETPLEIGNDLNEMFSLCPYSQTFLSDAMMSRDDRKVIGYQPNFFVSSKLGGFGVDRKYCRGRLHATLEQRRVAALYAQGNLSSFVRSMQMSSKAPCYLKTIFKNLPRTRISTQLGRIDKTFGPLQQGCYRSEAEQYIALGRAVESFEWKGILFPSSKDNYSKWVSLMQDPLLPVELNRRIVDQRKLQRVTPMNPEKVFELDPDVLVPYLPELPSGPVLRYYRGYMKPHWSVRVDV